METIRPAFHHATIKTNRLQEMIDWYCHVDGRWSKRENRARVAG